MKNVIIPTLTVLCLIPCSCINVSAEEINDSAAVYSAGLVKNYSVSLSSSDNSLLITGKTVCFETMKTVGITSITIQQSSDNSSWGDYADIGDLTKDSALSYSVSKHDLGTAAKGYYYRVTCKHYAKESGLFGSSESISNTSNSIYIPV